MADFDGKRVVVTGAAGALGGAVVAHFAMRGAVVAQVDLAAIDNRHRSYICDLSDAEACVSTAKSIADELGGIDVLANIAGGFAMGEEVHQTKAETWELMMGMNAGTLLNTVAAVAPHLLEAGRGKVVNVGAAAALRGAPRMGVYSAAKSAVIRLTESMAAELRERRINVNCVLPTIIDTPRNRREMPSADFGKWVSVDSLAAVVGFLASDAAIDIHGAAIPVSGLS